MMISKYYNFLALSNSSFIEVGKKQMTVDKKGVQ